MIQANELRIGNLVYQDRGTLRPHVINFGDFAKGADRFDEFTPIPLTEDTLLKCGFVEDEVKDELECLYLHIESSLKAENRNTCVHQICIDTKYHICSLLQHDRAEFVDTPKDIKSLHQLQNLYFALTGEELEITL